MFQTLNHLEAGLWVLIGLSFAIAGFRASAPTNRRCYLLAIVFVAFGVSDIVEARTGAWWRPWWLLTWKAACLAFMLWQLWVYAAARGHTERWFTTAAKFYVLGGLIQATAMTLLELAVVRYWVAHLAWRLGLWPSFPFPYDATDFGVMPGVLTEDRLGFLETFPASVVGLSLVIAAAHSLMFFLVTVAHIRFGSPDYWPDVRTKVSLRSAWSESARRSWWVWPAVQVLWLVWLQLDWGFNYAMYPIIDAGYPFLLANLAVVGLAYTALNASVLREHVAASVGPEELRCVTCGYLLRGLMSDRCPECGRGTPPDSAVDFRLRWERLRGWKPGWRTLRGVLVLAFLLGPLWVPAVIMRLPRPWLRFVPSVVRPGWQVVTPNPNAFPVRLDAACLIRCDQALAVVLFDKEGPSYARYTVGHWNDASNFGTRPPDSTSSGTVTNGGGPKLPVGPWDFTYGMASENMLWLTRPASTHHVEAAAREDFSGDLTWVGKDEANDGRP